MPRFEAGGDPLPTAQEEGGRGPLWGGQVTERSPRLVSVCCSQVSPLSRQMDTTG